MNTPTTYRFSLQPDWRPVNYHNDDTGEYVRNHNKVEAIKAVRRVTGSGLKESKQAVDALYNEGRDYATLDLVSDYEVTDFDLQTAINTLENNGIVVEKSAAIELVDATEAFAKLLESIVDEPTSTKDAVVNAAKVALENGDYDVANSLTSILAHKL